MLVNLICEGLYTHMQPANQRGAKDTWTGQGPSASPETPPLLLPLWYWCTKEVSSVPSGHMLDKMKMQYVGVLVLTDGSV